MKKVFKIIGVSLLIIILFRGWIYRSAISYNQIGTRENIIINNKDFLNKIESRSANKITSLEGIIRIANAITIEELSFSGNRVSNDPNELIRTKQANCIGYAALFNSVANYLIQKNGLGDEIEAKHLIGKLDLFGVSLHQFFDRPFFKDHDFNSVQHLITKKIYYIDSSLSDYLGIDEVVSN